MLFTHKPVTFESFSWRESKSNPPHDGRSNGVATATSSTTTCATHVHRPLRLRGAVSSPTTARERKPLLTSSLGTLHARFSDAVDWKDDCAKGNTGRVALLLRTPLPRDLRQQTAQVPHAGSYYVAHLPVVGADGTRPHRRRRSAHQAFWSSTPGLADPRPSRRDRPRRDPVRSGTDHLRPASTAISTQDCRHPRPKADDPGRRR